MKYVPRPGILATRICGLRLLIPTREAFDHCRQIQVMDMIQDAAWRSLCNGNSLENIEKGYQILTKQSEAETRAYFDRFFRTFAEKGFFLEVPEQTPAPTAEGEAGK